MASGLRDGLDATATPGRERARPRSHPIDAGEFRECRPYNAAAEFVDANVARGFADKVAFVDDARTLTYGELQQTTSCFGTGLLALGLRPERRLALLLPDTVDFPIVFWGAIRAGIIPVPLNVLLTSEQIAYILGDCRADAIVVSPSLLGTVARLIDGAPALRMVIVADREDEIATAVEPAFPTHRLAAVLARGTPEPWTAPTVSDEVAFWLYSSGSTGPPKGVKHVHSSLVATAHLAGAGVLGIHSDDVMFSAAKLPFAYGLGNSLSFPMSVGASAVLVPERPSPDLVLEVMRRHRPSIFCAVPSLYAALLAHTAIGPGAGSDRLRLCVSAAEPLPAHIGERWREVVGVDILDSIGSTEMLQMFLCNRPGLVRYGTSGEPVPGYEARIVGEDGHTLGDEEIGELVIRGPSAAEGYWNQRAKGRRTFVGEWTFTGDKYRRDRDGYFHYCGRADDMFKVNGYWVSPFAVEAALMSHEAVLEAAVIGRKDVDGLIKPKAFIVLKHGYRPDEGLFDALKAHAKARAGGWAYPRWIDVRTELPKTATGKIQRFKLRQEEEQGAWS
jgi:4-hydroxybenzoate-CoA ligase